LISSGVLDALISQKVLFRGANVIIGVSLGLVERASLVIA